MSSEEEKSENEIIYPDTESASGSAKGSVIEDDNKSTSSSVSATKIPRECFVCKKELQTRYMFNHIRKLHPYEFLCSLGKWKEEEMNAYVISAEAYPFEYDTTNDFDETETQTIYGCLACNNTFTSEARANGHTTNKKCKAGHIKGIKQMIKDEKESNKKKKKAPKLKTVQEVKGMIELEMRRYKHLCEISSELQKAFQEALQNRRPCDLLDDSKFYQIKQYDPSDYVADMAGGLEALEKQLRLWFWRVCQIEKSYGDLKEYLYYYSDINIDRFKIITNECPNRIYISYGDHEELGPSKYPAL